MYSEQYVSRLTAILSQPIERELFLVAQCGWPTDTVLFFRDHSLLPGQTQVIIRLFKQLIADFDEILNHCEREYDFISNATKILQEMAEFDDIVNSKWRRADDIISYIAYQAIDTSHALINTPCDLVRWDRVHVGEYLKRNTCKALPCSLWVEENFSDFFFFFFFAVTFFFFFFFFS